MAFTARAFDPAPAITSGYSAFGSGIGGGLSRAGLATAEAMLKYQETKQEKDFLRSTFETQAKMAREAGILDVADITKAEGGSVGALRGLVSGYGMKLKDYHEQQDRLERYKVDKANMDHLAALEKDAADARARNARLDQQALLQYSDTQNRLDRNEQTALSQYGDSQSRLDFQEKNALQHYADAKRLSDAAEARRVAEDTRHSALNQRFADAGAERDRLYNQRVEAAKLMHMGRAQSAMASGNGAMLMDSLNAAADPGIEKPEIGGRDALGYMATTGNLTPDNLLRYYESSAVNRANNPFFKSSDLVQQIPGTRYKRAITGPNTSQLITDDVVQQIRGYTTVSDGKGGYKYLPTHDPTDGGLTPAYDNETGEVKRGWFLDQKGNLRDLRSQMLKSGLDDFTDTLGAEQNTQAPVEMVFDKKLNRFVMPKK